MADDDVTGAKITGDAARWKHGTWPSKDYSVSVDPDAKDPTTTTTTVAEDGVPSANAPGEPPVRNRSKTLATGVKRRAERSPPGSDRSSTLGGAPSGVKRRRTGLYNGFHEARKLVTSLFGRRQPETVGQASVRREARSKEVTTVSTLHAERHLSNGEETDVTGLTQQLDLINFQDIKAKQSSRLLSNGRKQFNMDPKKGMEYLIEQNLVENTPQDVATFMYTAQGLSKTAIGQYLGERNAFNQEALKSFVNLHEFSQTNLVQALRHFLWSFRLPGEAQKIDRMMEQFADRYCQLNPGVFSSTDACYVLSFALIMLNTSLHNPNVKDKLTPDAFVAMNRGLQTDQQQEDLSRELIMDLYNSIKREPLKIPEDEMEDLMFTFFNPVKEGWLYKRGGRCKTWKRRWFILNDGCLYYFQYTTDKEPKGIIPLENVCVRGTSDRAKPNCFELYSTSTEYVKACKMDSFGKVIEGNHKVFRISASSEEEQDGWIRSIRSAISENPICDLINKRRRRSRIPSTE